MVFLIFLPLAIMVQSLDLRKVNSQFFILLSVVWTLLVVNMFLLRKQSQNHHADDSAQQEAKVISCILQLLFVSSEPSDNDNFQRPTLIIHQGLKSYMVISEQEKLMKYIYNQVKELRDALGSLSGRSLKYCTDSCLKRYLEARNWNVNKSKKMLEESLRWRATYKPEEIRWVRWTCNFIIVFFVIFKSLIFLSFIILL